MFCQCWKKVKNTTIRVYVLKKNIKGHSQLWDRADLETSFSLWKKFTSNQRNPLQSPRCFLRFQSFTEKSVCECFLLILWYYFIIFGLKQYRSRLRDMQISYEMVSNAHVRLNMLANSRSFSSPEPMILLACGRNRELWEQPFWNNKGNNRILRIRSHVVCIYGACLKWLLSELSIPAAGQKDRRLWGREWLKVSLGKRMREGKENIMGFQFSQLSLISFTSHCPCQCCLQEKLRSINRFDGQ